MIHYLDSEIVPAPYRTEEMAEMAAVIAEALLENNAKFNLTAITDPEEILHKHIADSLIAAALIEERLPTGGQRTMVDVGSGAGFPALPVAAAIRRLRVTALDATAKKCAHIRSTAARAKIGNLNAMSGRAEDVARDKHHREAYDVVTARAVANLPVLAELCLPLCRVGGFFLAMKGRSAPEEIATAEAGIARLGGRVAECREYRIPGDADPRYLVVIKKAAATPAEFPRQYGAIKKAPL